MIHGLTLTHIAILLVLALFVFGPERLPEMVEQAAATLRRLRQWLKATSSELTAELGPEYRDLDLRSLHPATFIRQHLLEDSDTDAVPGSPGHARELVPPGDSPPWDRDTT